MPIFFNHKGDFKKTERFLRRDRVRKIMYTLSKYGELGVESLREWTPKDTSQAANSWYYKVVKTRSGWMLSFNNSDIVDGVPLVILLQYGHGTRGGTFVEGRDFINPALKDIFDRLSKDIWKEVIT